MKTIVSSWWWRVAAVAVAAATMVAARPGDPGERGEYRDFKVLKRYSAQSGQHIFRAYVIEWEGEEVVARDIGALVDARSDRMINVMVTRSLPRPGQSLGQILFLARPEKKPPLQRADIVETPAEVMAANPPQRVGLRVNKVYALTGGDYAFRAYEVQWQGQDVIVFDPLGRSRHEVGETVHVIVSRHPYPDHSKPHALLEFYLTSAPPSAARRKLW